MSIILYNLDLYTSYNSETIRETCDPIRRFRVDPWRINSMGIYIMLGSSEVQYLSLI